MAQLNGKQIVALMTKGSLVPTYDGKILKGTFTISSTGSHFGDVIPQGGVTVYYTILDDNETGTGVNDGNYKESQVFVWYGYETNNVGQVVPVIYYVDDEYPDDVYNGDICYYEGVYEYNGVLYDKWRKVEDDEWDAEDKRWYLTNRVVDTVYRIEV